MTSIRKGRVGRGTLIALVALAVPLALAPAGAEAQGQATEPAFTPTLFVLGTTTDNEFRTIADPVGESSLYAEMELPFVFRGPRWSGGLSLNPAYRKYRELDDLDSFDTGVDAWLGGNLSKRTRLTATGGAARTAQLTGLDDTDIIAPRSDRVRGRAALALSHILNPAGDTLDVGLGFDTVEYLDDEFVSQRSYTAQVGLGKALGPRFSLRASGAAGRIAYGDGGHVDVLTPLAGFGYRVGPRTDLDVRAGVSFATGGIGTGDTARAVDRRTLAVDAGLGHHGESWAVSLSAGREIASGVVLGEPTVRTRLLASIGWADPRWRLSLSGGVSRNEAFIGEDGNLVLVLPEGLLSTDARQVDTLSSCLDMGYRLTGWMSVVGSGRFAYQRPGGVAQDLSLDVYRLSLGLALHPYAGPVNTSRGADVLRRYGRAGSIGSC